MAKCGTSILVQLFLWTLSFRGVLSTKSLTSKSKKSVSSGSYISRGSFGFRRSSQTIGQNVVLTGTLAKAGADKRLQTTEDAKIDCGNLRSSCFRINYSGRHGFSCEATSTFDCRAYKKESKRNRGVRMTLESEGTVTDGIVLVAQHKHDRHMASVLEYNAKILFVALDGLAAFHVTKLERKKHDIVGGRQSQAVKKTLDAERTSLESLEAENISSTVVVVTGIFGNVISICPIRGYWNPDRSIEVILLDDSETDDEHSPMKMLCYAQCVTSYNKVSIVDFSGQYDETEPNSKLQEVSKLIVYNPWQPTCSYEKAEAYGSANNEFQLCRPGAGYIHGGGAFVFGCCFFDSGFCGLLECLFSG